MLCSKTIRKSGDPIYDVRGSYLSKYGCARWMRRVILPGGRAVSKTSLARTKDPASLGIPPRHRRESNVTTGIHPMTALRTGGLLSPRVLYVVTPKCRVECSSRDLVRALLGARFTHLPHPTIGTEGWTSWIHSGCGSYLIPAYEGLSDEDDGKGLRRTLP